MVSQDIRDDEVLKLIDLMKGIDFCEPDQLKKFFDHKIKEEQDNYTTANQVAKDYRQGKFDP